MPARSVNLTDHYDEFVQEHIAEERFKNASEVMRAGLRLLEQETTKEARRLAVLRGLATEGFDALDRAEGTILE
jgi:antitoxin ParD1/3/4